MNRLESALASEGARNLGLLLLRVFPGLVFTYHGSQKLFGAFGGGGLSGTAQFFESIGIPFASANALLAGGTEFFGGLALLTGVASRIASLPLVFTMLVAIVTVHGSAFAASKGGIRRASLTGGASREIDDSGSGRPATLPGRACFRPARDPGSGHAPPRSSPPAPRPEVSGSGPRA